MKRSLFVSLAFFLSVAMCAEEPQQKFSPEKFQADLEQYITNEACLTPQEATKFFPLYREMQKKQRSVYNQMQALGMIKPTEEAECRKAIQKRDELEVELKSILQTYHNKFMGVLPASKVFDVIMAESKFHRKTFRNWGQGQQRRPPGHRPTDKKEHRK